MGAHTILRSLFPPAKPHQYPSPVPEPSASQNIGKQSYQYIIYSQITNFLLQWEQEVNLEEQTV